MLFARTGAPAVWVLSPSNPWQSQEGISADGIIMLSPKAEILFVCCLLPFPGYDRFFFFFFSPDVFRAPLQKLSLWMCASHWDHSLQAETFILLPRCMRPWLNYLPINALASLLEKLVQNQLCTDVYSANAYKEPRDPGMEHAVEISTMLLLLMWSLTFLCVNKS